MDTEGIFCFQNSYKQGPETENISESIAWVIFVPECKGKLYLTVQFKSGGDLKRHCTSAANVG